MPTTEYQTKFTHAAVPPSFNTIGNRGHWRAFHGEKKKWQQIFELKMLGAIPRKEFKRVIVAAHLRFPTKRKRDEGNFRIILEKAMGDALVNGGWLPDDNPEHYVFQHVTIEVDPGRAAQTTIHMRIEEN